LIDIGFRNVLQRYWKFCSGRFYQTLDLEGRSAINQLAQNYIPILLWTRENARAGIPSAITQGLVSFQQAYEKLRNSL